MSHRDEISAYCAKIGTDRLLVQAAGGNVSWKEGNTLWVKASGTWLANANVQDIFIPTDLSELRKCLKAGKFNVSPTSVFDSKMRPSIETLLHALIPSKFVLHTHSIEILATLVRANALEDINKKIGARSDWIFVDYFKPGAKLAEVIQHEIHKKPSSRVVFMQNHGVIIGAETIDQIDRQLSELVSLMKHEIQYKGIFPLNAPEIKGYKIVEAQEVHALVQHKRLLRRIENDWALYPDHVIFLDKIATQNPKIKPTHLFVPDVAVYQRDGITTAAQAQLLCYSDVIARQHDHENLVSLTGSEIAELLNWNAEKFRQELNANNTHDNDDLNEH